MAYRDNYYRSPLSTVIVVIATLFVLTVVFFGRFPQRTIADITLLHPSGVVERFEGVPFETSQGGAFSGGSATIRFEGRIYAGVFLVENIRRPRSRSLFDVLTGRNKKK